MYNAFGFRATKDADAEQTCFGDVLITRTVSEELKAAVDAEAEQAFADAEQEREESERAEEAAQQVRKLRIYKLIVYGLGMLTLLAMGMNGFDFGAMFRQNALLTTLMLLVLLITAVIFGADVYAVMHRKRTAPIIEETKPEAEHTPVDSDKEKELQKRIGEELGVPENAMEIEVLSASYKENGKMTSDSRLLGYLPLTLRCFADADTLYICYGYDLYAFAKSGFATPETVEGKHRMLFWAKEEAFDSEAYASYGIKTGAMGGIQLPSYVSFPWEGEGGSFALLIPPYDAPKLTELLK